MMILRVKMNASEMILSQRKKIVKMDANFT